MINWEGCGMKQSQLILLYYSSICLEYMQNTIKTRARKLAFRKRTKSRIFYQKVNVLTNNLNV